MVEDQLRVVLSEAGLQWVLDQVDEFVLEGKSEFKPLKGAQGDETEPYVKELTKRRGVPRSEPYLAAERLVILIEALDRITVQPSQLEKEIAAFLSDDDRHDDEEEPALDDVEWVDELDREPVRSIKQARSDEVEQVRQELHRILAELHARATE